jgi:hypothetical protein
VKGDSRSPAGHGLVTFLVGRHGGDTIILLIKPPICHAVAGSVQTPPSAAALLHQHGDNDRFEKNMRRWIPSCSCACLQTTPTVLPEGRAGFHECQANCCICFDGRWA